MWFILALEGFIVQTCNKVDLVGCPGCPPGHEPALGGQTCVVGPLVRITEQLGTLASQSLEISRQTDFLYSYFLAERECSATIPNCILCANSTACQACGEVLPPSLPPSLIPH